MNFNAHFLQVHLYSVTVTTDLIDEFLLFHLPSCLIHCLIYRTDNPAVITFYVLCKSIR
ncbi:MAG: hypothetical protein ABI857_06885 [Acidobacteriota bacterium]